MCTDSGQGGPSPPLTPVAGDGLDLLGRQLHDPGGAARPVAAIPAERVRALQLRAAERAVRAGRCRWSPGSRRSSGPRAVVEHGAALVAPLGVLRHEGAADRTHEPAEHDAASAETEIAVRVEFQRSAGVKLERTPGVELQGAARTELELPVRIEVQEARHRPPLSPSRYPGVQP